MSQLPLPLKLQDHAVFESFLPAGNEELHTYLQNQVGSPDSPGCFIWGRRSSGKTHLLQATCERAGDLSVYLPLASMTDFGPGVLDGLAQRRWICLDDVGAVIGSEAWETALFELWNAVSDNLGVFVMSAEAAPRELSVKLPDLASRLGRLTVFRCQELAEPDRISALQLRARHRGLELPDETAAFLLARSQRDMASLYQLLDRLDGESLAAKRRLTIPFVRSVLAQRA